MGGAVAAAVGASPCTHRVSRVVDVATGAGGGCFVTCMLYAILYVCNGLEKFMMFVWGVSSAEWTVEWVPFCVSSRRQHCLGWGQYRMQLMSLYVPAATLWV